MKNFTVKIFLAVSLGAVLQLSGSAIAADVIKDSKQSAISTKVGTVADVTFLSREVSKSLKITPIPTSESIPLIVGTYWNCHINSHDFEICRIKIVVCNDDQSFCVDVNGKQGSVPNISFLPQEESKSLKKTPIPTSEPTPFMVSTYWSCHVNSHELNICKLKIVICEDDDDGSSCISIN